MLEGIPKAIFLHGDEEKAFTSLKEWKKSWYPNGALSCEWEEIDLSSRGKGANIETVIESISCPPINECYRTFVIKSPGDNAKVRQSLINSIKNIPTDTTIILWDAKGLYDDDRTASPTWSEVKKVFQSKGKIVDTGKSLKDVSDVSQISWVVKTGEEIGLTISKECASLLLELYDRNRIMIESEIQNLSFMSDGVLDKDVVLENAMPIQQNYPVYKFYSAFNSGSYRMCMDAAGELLERGFTVEALLGFSTKQARWQIVVAEALKNQKDPKEFAGKIGAISHIKAREKLESDKSISREIFLKNPSDIEKDDLPKKESQPSAFAIREMVGFIGGLMSKLIPPGEKDKKAAICEQLMRRYVALVDGMLELRACKSEEKEACFARIIRRVTF